MHDEKDSCWLAFWGLALAGIAVFYLVFLYGVVPFRNGRLGIPFESMGIGLSLARGKLFAYPSHMGYPLGAPVPFGLPFALLQAIIIRCVGIDAVDAYAVTGLLFLLLAFLGTFTLARQIGADRIVAVFCATIYLSSPFVVFHTTIYAALGFAFTLFPTYFLIAWRSFDLISSAAVRWRKVAAMLMLGVTATCAVFMDGYSFTMLALMTGALAVYYLSSNVACRRWCDAAAIVVAYLSAFGAAYVLYTAYLPQAKDYALMSIDFFRTYGADAYTMIVPTRNVHYLYDLIGWNEARDLRLYYGGDVSPFSVNFLGIVTIIACFGVFKARLPKKLTGIILLATGLAFILSLGPSFKYRSYRRQPESCQSSVPDMPESAARFSLGTAWIYKKIPGIQVMRATYRWGLIIKSTLALFCFAALAWLRKTYGIWVMLAVSMVLILENIPPPSHFRIADRDYKMIRQFEKDVIKPLRKYLTPGEIVYFLPSGNDFAINYIAPKLGIRAYNVGGDKNVAISSALWPSAIRQMHFDRCPAVNAARLMQSGELDAVIVPLFDLRLDAYAWPPKHETAEQRHALFSRLAFRKPYFKVFKEQYFILVRRAPHMAEVLSVSSIVDRFISFSDSDESCLMSKMTGWSHPEPWGTWTDSEWASVTFDRNEFPKTDFELFADVQGFTAQNHPNQRVDILVNDVPVGTWTFVHGEGMVQRRIALPAEVIARQHPLTLAFHMKSPVSPFALGLSEDRRQLGIGIQRIRFRSSVPVQINTLLDSPISFNEDSIQKPTGWSHAEPWGTWSVGEWAVVNFDRYEFPQADLELLADVRGFTTEDHPEQSVEILANGVQVGTWTFSHGVAFEQRRVALPAEVIAKEQPLTLSFQIKSPVSPFSLGLSEDRRQLGMGIQRIRFRSSAPVQINTLLDSPISFNEDSIQKPTGWSHAEPWGTWSEGEWAVVTFDRYEFPQADLELLADVRGFTTEDHPEQSVDILANDFQVGTWTFSHGEGFGQHCVALPAEVIAKQQPLTLSFHIKSPASPFLLGISGDRRQLGIGIQSFMFRLAK